MLKPSEQKEPITVLELLVIQFGSQEFRPYIKGLKDIEVYTDHMPLRYLLTKMKDPHPLIATAIAYLASYDYHIRYIPGKFLPDVDALSRLHIEDSSFSDCEDSSFDIDEFINVLTNSQPENASNNDKPSLDINAFINVLTRSKTQELKKTNYSFNPEPSPQNTYHPNNLPDTIRVNNFDKKN